MGVNKLFSISVQVKSYYSMDGVRKIKSSMTSTLARSESTSFKWLDDFK